MYWKNLLLSLMEFRTWVSMMLTAAFSGGFIALADWVSSSAVWDKASLKRAFVGGAIVGIANHFRPRPQAKALQEETVDVKRFRDDPTRFSGPGAGPKTLVVLLGLALVLAGCGTTGSFRLGQEHIAAQPAPDLDTAVTKLCAGESEASVRSYLEDRVDQVAKGAPAARASVEEVYYRAWRTALAIQTSSKPRCPCFQGGCQK